MRTPLSIFVQAAVLISCAASTPAQSSFHPARIALASDVQFPINSVASGIVVIDVSLDAKGAITGTQVQRKIASLTSVADSSIRTWNFRPAALDGAAQSSTMRVAFAFRPSAIMVSPPAFEPLQQAEDAPAEANSGYIPPGILSVVYPAYPVDAVMVGAVIVQVRVNADGSVEDPRTIRSFRPFTRFSLAATKKWRFRPATLDGQPIAANVAIAFVYSAPQISY